MDYDNGRSITRILLLGLLISILSPADRLRGGFVLLALLAMAGIEVVGVAAVAAFVALMTDPSAASSNRWLAWLVRHVGVSDPNQALLPAGLALFGIIVVRNAISAFVSWFRLNYLHRLRKTLSTRLLASYLVAPYGFHLRANSTTLLKNLLAETNQLVTTYLYSWLVMIADGVTCVAILALLFYSNALVTLFAVGALGGVALGVLAGSRGLVRRLGAAHRVLNDRQFRTASEALGGIKELKVLGREAHALGAFADAANQFARVTIAFQLLNEIPRYVLEIVVFGGILAMAAVMVAESGSVVAMASTLALFMVAFYRLLPVTHRMLSSVAGLNFNHAVLADLSAGLRADADAAGALSRRLSPMPFERELELKGVSFSYEGAERPAIAGIDLHIPRGAAIALVGPTGAGKTTLADVILALHRPESGTMRVDGIAIDDGNRRSWQANLGYVPQNIHLADDTIRRNIAFGLGNGEIDDARVKDAARLAAVDGFLENMPQGLETLVGERGVRLSGGQRQRLGIARALYGTARLLVLDEATSSLDGITEAVIEDAIVNLSGKITVVIIAHRLSTVRHCDRIYLLEAGRIAAAGTYGELMDRSETFRAMARTT